MAALASTLRVLASVAPLALILASLGCQPQVGDPCKRASDCGLRVLRQCDVSNAPRDSKSQGECIVENCSFGACPNEATCVKVYSTELLSISCEPDDEDIKLAACDETLVCDIDGICRDPSGEPGEPVPDEVCPKGTQNCACDIVDECPSNQVCRPVDDCLPHEVCLPEGLCADEVRARTSCRRMCKKDNDCRPNYECVSTGAGGVYLAPDPQHPTQMLTESICVPR